MKVILTDDLFFRNLAFLRKKRRISCKALAQMLDVSPILLRGLEQGTLSIDPEWAMVQRLGQIFDLPPEELISKDLSAI